MTEYVFLPDRDADPESSFETIATAMSGAAKLSVAPRAESTAATGFSEATIELASRSVAASGPTVSDTAPEIEMVDYVQKTGVVLLRSSGLPEEGELGNGRIVPVHFYRPAVADVRVGRSKLKLQSGPSTIGFLTIRLLFKDDNSPVVGAVANLRRVGKEELSVVSDPDGVVTFPLRVSKVDNVRFMVEPGFAGHWGYLEDGATVVDGDTIEIERIDLTATPDALRHLIPPGGPTAGTGVRVAVIDSGVGPHPDLPNAIGDLDTSIGHGSHVAGIIGGHGNYGLGGVAPGVELLSYRVFDDPSTGVARNFEIHRAIEQAIVDDCQIVNLSLKSEIPFAPAHDDPVISRALEDAADAGVLCVAAAGNDFRRFVAFPARHPDAVAVSALGWEPGLPDSAFDRWTLSSDRSTSDQDVFFASFSNEGVDNTIVNLTGPGSGVISTVPGDTYSPMSGTSMACPAVVGVIARLISSNPTIMAMPADRTRTDAILELIRNNRRDAGFDSVKQGKGILA